MKICKCTGVTIDSVLIKDNTVTANTISAQNYAVGSTNFVSASRQGNFRDLEVKSGSNVVTMLIDGDTFFLCHFHSTLTVDTINEKTSANGVVIIINNKLYLVILLLKILVPLKSGFNNLDVNAISNFTLKGSIIPDTDDTYDIGSSTKTIRDLYLGPNSLYVNGKQILHDDSLMLLITFTTDENLSNYQNYR